MSEPFVPEDYCGPRTVIYQPGSEFPIDVPYLDEPTIPDPEDPDGGGIEVWTEVSRETSQVNVGGATIERMDKVRMRKPSGRIVELNFNN